MFTISLERSDDHVIGGRADSLTLTRVGVGATASSQHIEPVLGSMDLTYLLQPIGSRCPG